MASKTGSLGNVDAILTNVRPRWCVSLGLWRDDPRLPSECAARVVMNESDECEGESESEVEGESSFRLIADRHTDGPRLIMERERRGIRE